jgi:phytoene desaturase
MHTPIKAFESLAKELGVEVELEVEVDEVEVGDDGLATGVRVTKGGASETIEADIVVGTGDYHWIEQHCLKDAKHRRYSEPYWDKRVMSPGSLLFYLGINKRLKDLQHHNLFFDEDLDDHCVEIYKKPAWPKKPLFYVCVPSLTDTSLAPEGHENVFLLMPLAPGLEDTEEMREK